MPVILPKGAYAAWLDLDATSADREDDGDRGAEAEGGHERGERHGEGVDGEGEVSEIAGQPIAEAKAAENDEMVKFAKRR
jgi:hypothetical protein